MLRPETVTLQADGQILTAPTITHRRITERRSQWEVTNESHRDVDLETGVAGGIIVDASHEETMRSLSGGGTVCFAHDGSIPPTVRHLRLRCRQADFEPTFDFVLAADTPPTAWPSRRIVAPGYESLGQ